MPAEILNRLRSILPKIEASIAQGPTGASVPIDPLEKLKAEMRAMKFLWALPLVPTSFLKREEDLRCNLCHRKYDDEFSVCGRGESPCCLPCGHVAGHQCLRKYLSPYELGLTKCPFANCNVDFPQMFTDVVEPKQAISDLVKESPHDYDDDDDDDDYEILSSSSSLNEEEDPDEDLIRQISELSSDSGVSRDEISRYLSIGEVLGRWHFSPDVHSVSDSDISNFSNSKMGTGTQVRDFATADEEPLEVVGEEEFPKGRRMAVAVSESESEGWTRAAARRGGGLIARNF